GPRSDQFAFCVALWEALTGERPFRGTDLAELRAAGAGGAPPRGKLSPAVHAVLTRGLAADPDQRWPDLPALLAALERGLAPAPPPRSKVRLIAALVSVALIGGGVAIYALSQRGGGTAIASGCEAPDRVFASAWSPAHRSVIVKAHPGMATIAPLAILDETRAQWLRMYQETCAQPDTPQRHERLACLLEVRDEVASSVKELETADDELDITDVIGLATTVRSCGPR
ncbi:MAG: hypothetical protein ABI678_32705, partial [Kofleriaceae bacterium]